jgi:hypothetical protein
MSEIEFQMSTNRRRFPSPRMRVFPLVMTNFLLVLGLIATSVIGAPTAEAASRWREGWCKKDEGLSVVVDFSLTDRAEWPDVAQPNGWIIRCYRGSSLARFVGDGRTQSLEAVGLDYKVDGSSMVTSIEGVYGIGVAGGFWFYSTANLGAGATTWNAGTFAVSGNVTNWVQGVRFGSGTYPEPTPQYGPNALEASAPPVISGAPQIGQKVSADRGSWNVNPDTLSYQWYRDGVPIDGATSAEYVLTDADGGKTITVRLTGGKSSYEDVTIGSDGLAVAAGTLNLTDPAIIGSATVGSRLTAETTGWGPTPLTLSYQWLRGGAAIPGAVASTYLVTSGDLGQDLRVAVTATRQGYTAQTRTSAAVVGGLNQFRVVTPKITGTAKAGRTLTVKAAAWTPTPTTIGYQWYRWGKAIPGATKSTYKLTAGDRKTEITVRVTGSAADYQTVTASSAAVKVEFGKLTAATPKITGTAKVGETLKVKRGTWKPNSLTYTYQWYRSGRAITDARGASYQLVAVDRGKKITVKVTGVKRGYVTKSSPASKATGKVR